LKLLRYILFISLALPPMYASAANYQTDTILAFDSSNLWHIGENIHVLEDNENILDIRDVLLSKSFNKVELNVPNFGVTKNTHWILFTIHSNINHIRILQIELPDYKEIDIFDSLDFNNYESKSFSSEAVNSDKDIFFNYPLNLAQNETRTIAIKIVPNANLQLPISLVNYDTYDNSRLIRNRWIGLFTGVSSVYFTRLHVRYTEDKFPEDLFFIETSDRGRFQGRYVMRHPAGGDLSCKEGEKYVTILKQRRGKELSELAALTDWNVSKYSKYQETGSAWIDEKDGSTTPQKIEKEIDRGSGWGMLLLIGGLILFLLGNFLVDIRKTLHFHRA